MDEKIQELKLIAENARYLYTIGHITREEAKNDIMPYINAINKKAKELAKKYNQKPKLVSFNSFCR